MERDVMVSPEDLLPFLRGPGGEAVSTGNAAAALVPPDLPLPGETAGGSGAVEKGEFVPPDLDPPGQVIKVVATTAGEFVPPEFDPPGQVTVGVTTAAGEFVPPELDPPAKVTGGAHIIEGGQFVPPEIDPPKAAKR